MAPHSDLASRLVAAWFGVIWLLVLAAAILALARGQPLTSLPVMVLLGTLAVLSILALRARTRLFACLAATTIVVPCYIFEAYVALTAEETSIERVTQLRRQGVAAYPAVFPSGFVGLWHKEGMATPSPIVIGDQPVLPLAGIAQTFTVYCQTADDDWISYDSDIFGFRNSVAAVSDGAPDLALLGDSFVQGFCVPDDATYAARLKDLGETVGYGINGTSVLAQLAIFREYVKAVQPRHVIWFFYEGNDPRDYLVERTSPILRAYFRPDYLQDLRRMNEPMTAAMTLFVDERLDSADIGSLAHERSSTVLDFLLLRRTRRLLRPARFVTELSDSQWREIADQWREVIETQHGQGGRTTFVYIPAHWRFVIEDAAPFQALEHKVVTLWSDLGVDWISFSEPLAAQANPLAYYDGLHFNAEGYRMTAEFLAEHLRHASDPDEDGQVRSGAS